MSSRPFVILFASFALVFSFSVVAKPFQARDHLTPEEQELVKDAQILDKRIEIFVKAADRRLLALNGVDAGATKQLKKDSEKWGELPTGSRAELVRDVAKILDEAITNIDDVSSRDERNPLIPKALRLLAAEATRVVERLKPLQAQAKGEAEFASFEELMENADSILQAANKLPAVTEKKTKAKGKS
ncbi:MAG: hypothetical protein ACRD6N_09730 [Pyrinomonadaceae bacterium]